MSEHIHTNVRHNTKTHRHKLKEIDPSRALRMVLQNPKGLEGWGDKPKWSQMGPELQQAQVGLVGMPESNRNWSQ